MDHDPGLDVAGTLEINARIMTPIVLFHRPAMQGNGHVPGPPDRPVPRPEYARTDASSASRLPSPRCLNPRSPFPAHFFPCSPPFPLPARRPSRIEGASLEQPPRSAQIFRRIEVSREIMEIAVIPGNQRRRRVAQTFRTRLITRRHARANIQIPRLFSRPRKYACTKRGPLLYHGLISP